MGEWNHKIGRGMAWVALTGLSLALGMGCASTLTLSSHYDYFQTPDDRDPWSPKIAGWQRREAADAAPMLGDTAPSVDGPGSAPLAESASTANRAELRTKYSDFRAQRKRHAAREFAKWIQTEAKNHYVADGPIDHWATLEETLRSNGDDCDGLELLVFQGLRDLGFDQSEVFRAIVYRPEDGQHHMVTLWFEERTDPWVIDPTGAMTSGMPRMSEVPGWVPLKVFSDTAEFSVGRVRDLTRDAVAAAELD